jgi:hypothetical protein
MPLGIGLPVTHTQKSSTQAINPSPKVPLRCYSEFAKVVTKAKRQIKEQKRRCKKMLEI